MPQVTLRDLIFASGVRNFGGLVEDTLHSHIHRGLRKAAQAGHIRHRQGARWTWREHDQDLPVVMQVIREECAGFPLIAQQFEPAHRVDSSTRGEERPGAEIEAMTLLELQPVELPAPNDSLQQRDGEGGQGQKDAPSRCKPTLGKTVVKKLKRKFIEMITEEGEAELKSEWETLSGDTVKTTLLALRYGSQQRAGRVHDRLRSTLDRMISSSSMSAKTMFPAQGAGSSRPSTGACPTIDDLLSAAQLPHPALLSLEHDEGVAASCLGSAGLDSPEELGREADIVAALQRYASLNDPNRAALWCLLASRSRAQELAFARAVFAQKSSSGTFQGSLPPNAFDAFKDRAGVPLVSVPGMVSRTFGAEDPLALLDLENIFLKQSSSQQREWFRRAEKMRDAEPLGQMSCANWKPSAA
mmetsp:Transcript_9371/g.29048  ORF Transcript_9371/g.29048 Transcript_9371/m.29048 type:complete len:414 (+) Transcript_9371:39-1280(+)